MGMSMRNSSSQMNNHTSHCESIMDKGDPESVWKEDITALHADVKKLEGEAGGENAADVIRQIMKKENVNQKELAERLGCGRQICRRIC